MGLTGRARRRARALYWRLRHWWFDTESGRKAGIASGVIAALVFVAQCVQMAVVATRPEPPPQAAWFWVVSLIIMVVAAAWAYSQRPKPQQPQEQAQESPLTADGVAAKDYFGTCWIAYDQKALLAWKPVGRDPIYGESGKK